MIQFLKKVLGGNFAISLSKWQIKLLLALTAFGIVLSVIYYTQSIAQELIRREQKLINFYAAMVNNYSDLNKIDDFLFFTRNVNPAISFPVIMTDQNNVPIYPYEQNTLNIKIDTSLPMEKQKQYLENYVHEMGQKYKPIVIRVKVDEDEIVTKFYYTHSTLINNLRYFPIVSIVIISAFILIGYMAFSSVRRHEESKVWVGMAKEAAHQLGTPLSSMLAWIEIIKINKNIPTKIEETIGEMQNDIERLNKIATRFSKIGSLPEKRQENLAALIERVCVYFERRMPHLGKKVEIFRDSGQEVMVQINGDLFEWVFENLLRNAAEAIEGKHGKIEIRIFRNLRKKILITVKDNGKGMPLQLKRQIFNPGFTTKKRGWGLGLSLVKRIIEEYHNGKIYVRDTAPGEGTTFVIELPVTQTEDQ